MAEPARIGVALLAAGSSQRFGKEDKLSAPFRGRPLGEHAAAALPMTKCAKGWAITTSAEHLCLPFWSSVGLESVVNPTAQSGMGASVVMAASLAGQADCDALLVALADMPLVPTEHFMALITQFDGPNHIGVSSSGGSPMPPALFGKDHFVNLSELSGDIGARALLAQGQAVQCPPDWLIDIDTPEALIRAVQ